MIGADLSKKVGELYVCPECSKQYTLRWIRRHLIAKHGYRYYENILINPQQGGNKE